MQLLINVMWIIAYACMWECVCHTFPSWILSASFSYYNTLTESKQMQWNIKCTNIFFSIFSLICASIAHTQDEFALIYDPIYTTTPFAQWVLLVVSGFFLWDICICFIYYNVWGFQYVLHGFFCFSMFVYVYLSQMGTGYMLYTLYYESSTIFMNLRCYLLESKKTDTLLWHGINTMFIVCFYLSRIIFGTWLTYQLWSDLLFSPFPQMGKAIVFINSILSYGLNLYWGSLMIKRFMMQGTRVKNKK